MKFFSNLQVGNNLCKIFLKIKHGTWLDSRKHFLDFFFFMAVLERFFLQFSDFSAVSNLLGEYCSPLPPPTKRIDLPAISVLTSFSHISQKTCSFFIVLSAALTKPPAHSAESQDQLAPGMD